MNILLTHCQNQINKCHQNINQEIFKKKTAKKQDS